MDVRRWSGDRVREAREAGGLSQQAVADALSVRWASVSDWERGQAEPGVNLASALADLLGVPVDAFLVHVPEPAMGSTDRGKTPDGASTAKQRAAGTHQGA